MDKNFWVTSTISLVGAAAVIGMYYSMWWGLLVLPSIAMVAHHVYKDIKEGLNHGETVLCDRVSEKR